ncbi:MAG: pirin family protein, partial [Bdellovibrionales bacterium]|nr:pirin family protein [Bdellovibrionales bacterium]
MSTIETIIIPKAKDLGDDFFVRRSLPDIKQKMVGPFVFWDHMGPTTLEGEKQMKVRAHPHIGLATITWLFSGEIMHRDSLGNEQAIRPGEVNWMTAGSGIAHSERSVRKDKPEVLEGIQLWLALPKYSEDVAPSFYHCKEEDVPLISKDGVKLRLIA